VASLRAGLEVQSMSRRRSADGEVAGHTVTNLTLIDPSVTQSLTASFSVYKPVRHEIRRPCLGRPLQSGLDSIPQPRRSFLLKLTYIF